jgi:hypothetical protein
VTTGVVIEGATMRSKRGRSKARSDKFAADSPLEEGGFELLVPLTTQTPFRMTAALPRWIVAKDRNTPQWSSR